MHVLPFQRYPHGRHTYELPSFFAFKYTNYWVIRYAPEGARYTVAVKSHNRMNNNGYAMCRSIALSVVIGISTQEKNIGVFYLNGLELDKC